MSRRDGSSRANTTRQMSARHVTDSYNSALTELKSSGQTESDCISVIFAFHSKRTRQMHPVPSHSCISVGTDNQVDSSRVLLKLHGYFNERPRCGLLIKMRCRILIKITYLLTRCPTLADDGQRWVSLGNVVLCWSMISNEVQPPLVSN